ncbi:MAG: ABC transporter permease DevC [Cyanobacteria bacterium P01_H01_bin.15]
MNLLKSIFRRTPLGWNQLWRDKTRLLTAIAGIAFADILIFMQLGFRNALFDTNTSIQRKLDTDLVLISSRAREMTRLYTFPRRRLYQALDIPGVLSADALYVNFLDWRNPVTRQLTPMLVIGQNPTTPTFHLPEVNQQLDLIKLPDHVLFDATSRGEYGELVANLSADQTMSTEIERRSITIAGQFEVGAAFAFDGILITSDQNFLRLFPKRSENTPSMGLLKIDPSYDADLIRAQLNATLPADVIAFTLEEYIDFEYAYWNERTPIGFVFGFGSAMGFVVGVVIVYQVLSTDVNAHLAEYATFKAMGFRDRYFLFVLLEESLVLTIMGFLPGYGISLGLYRLAREATALPMYLVASRVIFVFVLTGVMCCISGAIASRRLQNADPADIY